MKILITASKVFGIMMGVFLILGLFMWIMVLLTEVLIIYLPMNGSILLTILSFLVGSVVISIIYAVEIEK